MSKDYFTLKDVVDTSIYDPTTGWRDRLPDEVITLTEAQKESFLGVFGGRCHEKTKRRLRSFINYPSYISPGWWLERVQFHGDRCNYCAGRSYPDEIATIRKIIVNG